MEIVTKVDLKWFFAHFKKAFCYNWVNWYIFDKNKEENLILGTFYTYYNINEKCKHYM